MAKKDKFKPVISRIKLNPEQAVLTCACFNSYERTWSIAAYRATGVGAGPVCSGRARQHGCYSPHNQSQPHGPYTTAGAISS